MPYLSKADIELIAQRVITAYKRLPICQEYPLNTIQPEILIHDLLGLSADHHLLSRNGTILGLTACSPVGIPIFDAPEAPEYYYLDGKTLLIDTRLLAENANKGRYHFTLIHEASHQIYRMLFPREYMSGINRRRVHYCMNCSFIENNDWEEWRTNSLTSAILMPIDMILNNMAAFGLGNKLEMLNKVFAPEEYTQFEKMAEYMGVSKQALAIRLQHLGLLGLNHLQNPYELVDIFPEEEDHG